jgi:hypothetical protein
MAQYRREGYNTRVDSAYNLVCASACVRFPGYHHCRGQERNAGYETGCTLWLVSIGDNVCIRFLPNRALSRFSLIPCWKPICTKNCDAELPSSLATHG